MSSNNLDVKILLQYITKSLNNWGLEYISEQILKKSKNNQPQVLKQMIRFLFDLSILHILNYDYFIDQLNIESSQQQQIQIILAHLFQINCPMIIIDKSKEEQQHMIGFDFSSSKNILITCGWMMAVSNFFSMTTDKLFKKKLQQIYQSKAVNSQPTFIKQKSNNPILNLYEYQDSLSRISNLYKLFQRRRYRVECLISKKGKILQYLRKQLKALDENVHLQDLLNQNDPQQIQRLQFQLKQMITYQKLNMSNRKYWWLWLDQKIIMPEYTQLSNMYESFQKMEKHQDEVKYQIQVDLDYVKKYYNAYNDYQRIVQDIGTKMQELQFDFKKSYKEIQRQIHDEIKHQMFQHQGNQICVPSFIGLQIKQYLKLELKKENKEAKTSKKGIQKSRKRLAQSVKTFIKEIQELVFI